MFYVGIDIAKQTHYAAITNSFGEIVVSPFPFENSLIGFQILLSKISSLNSKDVLIGYEATAHYSRNLSYFLLSKGFNVGVLNPLQTSSLRKSNIRNAKNDKIDSLVICTALSLNYHHRVSIDTIYDELYSLCVSRANLVTMRSRSKIQLVTYIDQIFPELASFFKDNLHLNTCYELLKQYSNPQKMSKVRIDVLTNLLKSSSHGRYKRDDAIKLKAIASNSVGIYNTSVEMQINLAIQQIQLYSSQVEEILITFHLLVKYLLLRD